MAVAAVVVVGVVVVVVVVVLVVVVVVVVDAWLNARVEGVVRGRRSWRRWACSWPSS